MVGHIVVAFGTENGDGFFSLRLKLLLRHGITTSTSVKNNSIFLKKAYEKAYEL